MRIPEDTIIAIFGPTCSGKTEVARSLHRRIGGRLRCCGEEVKEAARLKGVTLDALEKEDHFAVDEMTRRAVRDVQGRLIVEGTFLDSVLRDVKVPLIKVIATDDERLRRMRQREGGKGEVYLRARDDQDERVRRSLYTPPVREADICIDTTGLTLDQVSDKLLAELNADLNET
jgi:cytidylate kinase